MPTNFIKTKDSYTAEKLKAQGLKLISYSYDMYVFVNDSKVKVNFESIDPTKVYYTNVLHI